MSLGIVFVEFAWFDLVFLYGLVFFFSFGNGGGGFLFGGLIDNWFIFEKSCILIKFLVFLGVGL